MDRSKNNRGSVRIARKEAIGMEELIRLYIKSIGLSTELNRQRIYAAWSKVSGAAAFTLDRYVKAGVLYCTISSSMMRSRLFLGKDRLVEIVNDELRQDSLFSQDNKTENFIKSIVLR